MQHATVVQNDVPLIEPIRVPVWVVQDLLTPGTDRRPDLLTERVSRDRIEQSCRIRPSKDDTVFAQDPPHHERIAVIGSDQGLTAVVEKPGGLFALAAVPQSRDWEKGSL